MIEYVDDDPRLTADAFVSLAQLIWPRAYDTGQVAQALARTSSVSAWHEGQLVGCVRVLTDGYLFATIPEILVRPAFQRQGIGRTLMKRALALAPRQKVFFGAQPGNEPFFERLGAVRGPTGYVLQGNP
jgi:GNAT superfamily N-acetyltransferase